MQISQQYCIREQALKLIELGVINEIKIDDPEGMKDERGNYYKVPNVGCYYSAIIPNSGTEIKTVIGVQEDAPYEMYKPVKLYSCAELGVMLPEGYTSGSVIQNSPMGELGKWCCCRGDDDVPFAYADTEAESRAEVLIKLLDKNVILPFEVNQRLRVGDSLPKEITEEKPEPGSLEDFLNPLP